MNNLRQSQSAPVVDHFKQNNPQSYPQALWIAKTVNFFYDFFHLSIVQAIGRSLKCAPILCDTKFIPP